MSAKHHVIYGPPGTGKTTEIVARVKKHLESGTSPNHIGLTTFTKAAAEMLGERSGLKTSYLGTLHSLAFRQADLIKEGVLGYDHLKEFSNLVGIPLTGQNPEEGEDLQDGDAYLFLYGLAKAKRIQDRLVVYDASERPGTPAQYLYFCESLDNYKKAKNLIDYNDMLLLALTAPPPPLKVLFIDEAQDLSPLQWELVYHWARAIPEIHICGDDDQCIYDWAGADVQGMYQFEKDFNAERKVLSQSHRVPKLVHELASRITLHMGERVDKKYGSRQEEGIMRYYLDADFVRKLKQGDDVMMLFRNHSVRDVFEDVLIDFHIPYTVIRGKGGLLDNHTASTIKTYLKFKQTGFKHGGFLMTKKEKQNFMWNFKEPYASAILNTEEPYPYGEVPFWEKLKLYKHESIQYYKSIFEEYGTIEIVPTIRLATIHASKGLEAQRVILLNGMGGRTADNFNRNSRSEARVFYVGVTRAKERLDIVQGPNSVSFL